MKTYLNTMGINSLSSKFGKGVSVKFPGTKGSVNCPLAKLSRSAPARHPTTRRATPAGPHSDLEQPAPKLRRHDQPTGKKRALQGLGDADDEDGAQPAQKFGGRKPRVEWSREEVKFLLEGYSKHWNVVDCWTKILDDSYDFHPCRTGTNLKDKFRNLVKDGLAVDKRKEKGGLKHKGK